MKVNRYVIQFVSIVILTQVLNVLVMLQNYSPMAIVRAYQQALFGWML